MTRILIALALIGSLSACQSIPKERTNNCACNWEIPSQQNGAVT
ncbi:hypothetical protein [Shinella kummerowiae]|jgi:hypothetical protein|nr:hypothetical protein [Shinella kummerowiae]MCT7667475.1 hypothetical protein [Shinella kummerowiae]